MAKVVTFGELMIRLQPYNYERFVQADHLEFTFGGGEANVAVSLANYGLDAAEGELQVVGLDKALIVVGLEPDHQLAKSHYFGHFYFLLNIFVLLLH